MIPGVEWLLDVKKRPAGAHGEFQRPRVARVVNNAVHVHITDVIGRMQLVFDGLENPLGQQALVHITDNGSLLASGAAQIIVHQFLEFPVLAPALIEPAGAKPPTNGHFYPADKFLEDEVAFQLVGLLPPLEHEHEVVRALSHIRESLIRIAGRF